ncbi:MAG: hypothetical protein IPK72_13840 [Candidatus Eisenbacteria bacterium]|nr:hypothetical protein [Candidatus Eisenbacteria bacterium]
MTRQAEVNDPRQREAEQRVAARPRNRTGWMSWITVAALAALGAGCDEEGCCFDGDGTPPPPPADLRSVTGDQEIELFWRGCDAEDLDGYAVYRSRSEGGSYRRIASVGPANWSYVDRNVDNGETYWYAVAAFDYAGNESDFDGRPVRDTPRPEGFGLRLWNTLGEPRDAGYDFSADRIVDSRSVEADVYFWANADEGPWMVATERNDEEMTDIQDVGPGPIRQVDWAPEDGWSPRGEVPLIEGHNYVVWTWDNHFAKFRVLSVSGERVVLDWAYQLDAGNPELAVHTPGTTITPVSRQVRVLPHEVGMERRMQR